MWTNRLHFIILLFHLFIVKIQMTIEKCVSSTLHSMQFSICVYSNKPSTTELMDLKAASIDYWLHKHILKMVQLFTKDTV